MGLIKGIKDEKKKKDLSLLELIGKYFKDEDVITSLKEYLTARKQQHNMPSKIAWEKQLEMLLKVQPQDRKNMVDNSILKGYRQIVYLDSYKPSTEVVTRVKSASKKVNQSF